MGVRGLKGCKRSGRRCESTMRRRLSGGWSSALGGTTDGRNLTWSNSRGGGWKTASRWLQDAQQARELGPFPPKLPSPPSPSPKPSCPLPMVAGSPAQTDLRSFVFLHWAGPGAPAASLSSPRFLSHLELPGATQVCMMPGGQTSNVMTVGSLSSRGMERGLFTAQLCAVVCWAAGGAAPNKW
ncbi:hypothetical protein GQ53DRAFT_34114 [Thozetella sp. PMI_491]|nr:hypothetical protein GQ53DRAFT_34114 [Thozetella sp. PMI_491]